MISLHAGQLHKADRVSRALVDTTELDFGSQSNIYGLFKSAKEATSVLAALAAEYALCHAVLELEKVKSGKPCFAHQVRKCKGACVGAETLAAHSARLVMGLSKLRLKSWPFVGPAYLKEGDEVLVIDHWCYLGAARSDEDLWPLLEQRRPQFDRDTYRILSKVVSRMRPLAARHTHGRTPALHAPQ